MSDIVVSRVESKKDFKAFLKFPWRVYEGDPNWVPPLLQTVADLLNPQKNPFYEHAEIELFLARRGEEIVGRVAAVKNDGHLKIHDDGVGFFGFFEALDDQAVADALLAEAERWLKERGLKAMRGPANPSSNDEWAALYEGYDDPPQILMTYNPPYYHKLFENYGLAKAKDLYAYRLKYDAVKAAGKLTRVAGMVEKRYGLRVRPLNMKDYDAELDRFKMVYNKAWEKNWGFVPLTDNEIDAMAKELKMIIEPSVILFAELEGEVVGAALVLLDYNQVFKKMNGKILPFGWLKLFTEKKKISRLRIVTLGVLPEYRKRGFDAVLYREITDRGDALGIREGEASWVLEDNEMMNRAAEMMNAERYKTYRVYEKPIA